MMTGKRVLITGPTSGIGKEIAVQLAALGAEVILACRDRERGNSIAEEITRRTGSKNCTILQVDMASQRSIKGLVKNFKERYPRLDVLINNAGIHRSKREVNDAGVELTFATNVLGYYYLTRELLDVLRASAPSRIVNVASTYATDLDLTDLQFQHRSYKGSKAYAQSKACDRMLTWAFARRLEESGVTANAMAPGLVQTGLYRNTPSSVRLILRMMGLFFGRSVEQGADTALWLSSSPDVEGITGKFFERRKEVPCIFRNLEAEETLWRTCEGLTGIS